MHHQPTYSQIIDPASYNRLIAEHLYIAAADRAIREILRRESKGRPTEVVEIGTGPARILPLLASVPKARLTGIDHDETFVTYGRELIRERQVRAEIILADVMNYQHPSPVDIFVSQGFHHHVAKGEEVRRYLENCYRQLQPGGLYICGDEFLPEYQSDEERLQRAVIWYSHIIAAALKRAQQQLAIEEAKTLLDDLAEGRDEGAVKSEAQIELLLGRVREIDRLARSGERQKVGVAVHSLLRSLAAAEPTNPIGDPSIDLSRGDFKIDHQRFVKEVESVGFKVVGVQSFGPITTIGGMAVYLMRK